MLGKLKITSIVVIAVKEMWEVSKFHCCSLRIQKFNNLSDVG